MRTPEEVAEDAGIGVDDCGDLNREDLAEVIRARDAEVRAETLAGLTYESCGTNRLGQPTRRLVGPVEVEP